jgi:hypothetical protein
MRTLVILLIQTVQVKAEIPSMKSIPADMHFLRNPILWVTDTILDPCSQNDCSAAGNIFASDNVKIWRNSCLKCGTEKKVPPPLLY